MALLIGANTRGCLAPKLESEISADLQIARGKVRNWRTVFISSLVENLTSTTSDVWEVGGTQIPPTVAAVASIVSDSVADTAAGTGARAVLVAGLDADFNEISEVVAMNGLTPVSTAQEFYRLFSMTAVSAGTTEANEGVITASIGGDAQSAMMPGDSNSFNSHYTVPAGHRLYLRSVNFFQGANKTVTTAFMSRPPGLPWITLSKLQVYRIAEEVNQVPIPVEEKTDIKVVANNDGGGVSSFTVIINYYLEKL